MLSIISEFAFIPFLHGVGKVGAGLAGAGLVASPIADKGLEMVGYRPPEPLPGEKIDLNFGPPRMGWNQAFGGLINSMDKYSEYTREHPVMGYGVIPGAAITGVLGAGYIGKQLLSNKNNPRPGGRPT